MPKIIFSGGLTDTFREEYKERLKYKNLVNLDGLIDIWYGNYEYGLLNKDYEPSVLAEDTEALKNFPGLADGVNCLGFVADAFLEFRNEYVNLLDNSTLDYPPFLEGLIPLKGHRSFENLFANWSAYSISSYSSFMQNDVNILDYQSFLKALKSIFMKELRNYPVTKSGFCLSKHNDIKTTGLVIELTNLKYDIDLQKGEIVQSPNFSCFLAMANKHGFYVDKNAPWRLLANLNSPAIRSGIRGLDNYRTRDPNHREFSTIEILDSIYRTRTHFDDLYILQDFVLKTYNQLKKNVPSFSVTDLDLDRGRLVKQNISRTEPLKLSTLEWLDLLVMVRLLEIGKYTPENHSKYYDMATKINKIYDVRRVLSMLGKEFSILIKEDFTKRKEEDIMLNTLQRKTVQTERSTNNGSASPQPTNNTSFRQY